MATFEVGQTVSVAITTTSDGTTLANVGAMTCQVTKPDGTTAAATVTNPSTGNYLGSLVSTLPGRYRFTFSATGANSGGTPWSDVADVWAADPRMLISLADAKAALNVSMPGYQDNTNDDEIRLFIAAATPIIEDITGPILVNTKTHTFDGGRGSLILPEGRISGVTSITVNGATLDPNAYRADLDSGVIWAYYGQFQWGIRNIVVTYTVGNTTVPPNIVLAARELVRVQYGVTQQAPRPSFGQIEGDTAWTPSGYAVPQRVIAMCAPQRLSGL